MSLRLKVAVMLWVLLVIVSCVGLARIASCVSLACQLVHPHRPMAVQDWIENAG
jgi:hypothetical protein